MNLLDRLSFFVDMILRGRTVEYYDYRQECYKRRGKNP